MFGINEDSQDEFFRQQFAALIDAKLTVFRSIAVKIVNSTADADDAVQCALIKAWDKRTTFRNQAALSTWVSRIVISEAYNVLRQRMRAAKKNNHFRISQELLSESDGNESTLNIDNLELAIMELPEIYRDTVQIGILSGMDSGKAAEILGCSVNAMYQRIHKAKELLRNSMQRWINE